MDIEGTLRTDLVGPLKCWDIVSLSTHELNTEARKKVELLTLAEFQLQFGWKEVLDEILSDEYEALILTDSLARIKWVNEGFTRMTGYDRQDVLGRSPKMLQGENTTNTSRSRVRKSLDSGIAFSETLINYRKNGEEYICDVDIYPLHNDKKKLTHYLALEREVKY